MFLELTYRITVSRLENFKVASDVPRLFSFEKQPSGCKEVKRSPTVRRLPPPPLTNLLKTTSPPPTLGRCGTQLSVVFTSFQQKLFLIYKNMRQSQLQSSDCIYFTAFQIRQNFCFVSPLFVGCNQDYLRVNLVTNSCNT